MSCYGCLDQQGPLGCAGCGFVPFVPFIGSYGGGYGVTPAAVLPAQVTAAAWSLGPVGVAAAAGVPTAFIAERLIRTKKEKYQAAMRLLSKARMLDALGKKDKAERLRARARRLLSRIGAEPPERRRVLPVRPGVRRLPALPKRRLLPPRRAVAPPSPPSPPRFQPSAPGGPPSAVLEQAEGDAAEASGILGLLGDLGWTLKDIRQRAKKRGILGRRKAVKRWHLRHPRVRRRFPWTKPKDVRQAVAGKTARPPESARSAAKGGMPPAPESAQQAAFEPSVPAPSGMEAPAAPATVPEAVSPPAELAAPEKPWGKWLLYGGIGVAALVAIGVTAKAVGGKRRRGRVTHTPTKTVLL